MSTEYKEGARIKCIKRPENGNGNFGRLGTVTEVDEDGIVYVEYDNGNTGQSNKPELYYQIVTYTGVKAGKTRTISSPSYRTSNNFMDGALNIVKRMTLTADDKKLIRAGLMTECGLYTDQATAIVEQEAAAAARTRLLEVATAIIADRKEAKEDAE